MIVSGRRNLRIGFNTAHIVEHIYDVCCVEPPEPPEPEIFQVESFPSFLLPASCGIIDPLGITDVEQGSNFTLNFSLCSCDDVCSTVGTVGWATTDNSNQAMEFSPDPATTPEGTTFGLFTSSGPFIATAEGMAYCPSLMMLFVFTVNGDMYLVDPSNKTASTSNPNVTFVGSTGLLNPQGAEVYYDPTTNLETFYVVDDNGFLNTVDKTTGAVLTTVNITGSFSRGDGLAINPDTGEAFVQNDDTVAVHQIDLTTGVTTFCYNTNISVDGEGLAFGSDGYIYIEDEGQGGGGRAIYRFLPPPCGSTSTVVLEPVATHSGLTGDVESIAFNGGACQICQDIGIVDVLIDGVSVGPVTSYTFINIQQNHTVEVVFGLT